MLPKSDNVIPKEGVLPRFFGTRRQSDQQEVVSQSMFLEYQVGLFSRLDVIISMIGNLQQPDQIQQASQPQIAPGEPERDEHDDEESPGPLAAFLGGLAYALGRYIIRPLLQAAIKFIRWIRGLVGRVGSFFRGIARFARRTLTRVRLLARSLRQIGARVVTFFRRTIPNYLRRIGSEVSQAIERVLLRMRSILVEKLINPLKSLIRTVLESTGRLTRSASRALTRVVGGFARSARFTGSIIRRMGSLGGLYDGLKIIGRRLPLIATLVVPVMEGIEANHQIQELTRRHDAGEISDDVFRQQSTQSVVQAVLDSIGIIMGTTGGAALGTLLGPLGTLAGGVVGGLIGEQFAHWIGPMIAPQIAAAVNSTNVDQLVRNISDLFTKSVPEFIASIPDRIRALQNVGSEQINHALQQFGSTVERTAAVIPGGTALMHESAVAVQWAGDQVQQAQAAVTRSLSQPTQTTQSTVVIVNAPTRNITNTVVSSPGLPTARRIPDNIAAGHA